MVESNEESVEARPVLRIRDQKPLEPLPREIGAPADAEFNEAIREAPELLELLILDGGPAEVEVEQVGEQGRVKEHLDRILEEERALVHLEMAELQASDLRDGFFRQQCLTDIQVFEGLPGTLQEQGHPGVAEMRAGLEIQSSEVLDELALGDQLSRLGRDLYALED